MSALRFRLLATWAILAITAAAVSSCASGTAGQSGRSEGESGAAAQSAELRMSGGYVVNEDGTLRKPETTMTEPVLNRAALRFDAEGAELAARHYLALTEYAWATGDTGPMREFATDECQACQNMADSVDLLEDSGGWVDGTKYTVLEVGRVELIEGRSSTFGIQMTIEEQETTSYSGGILMKREAQQLDMAMFLNWANGEWKVVGESAEIIS